MLTEVCSCNRVLDGDGRLRHEEQERVEHAAQQHVHLEHPTHIPKVYYT